MDRSPERRKPLPYSQELTGVVRGALFSSRLMNHHETNIGHIGVSLPDPNLKALARVGIYIELFQDLLPDTDVAHPGQPKLDLSARIYLERASHVARLRGSDSVLVSHLTEAMVSPDLPFLMEAKFSRTIREPLAILRPRATGNTEAA